MPEQFSFEHWSAWLPHISLSAAVIGRIGLQAGLIIAAFALAAIIRLVSRAATDRLLNRHVRSEIVRIQLTRLLTLAYAWVLLVIAERVAAEFRFSVDFIGIAATLTALWIVLRSSSVLFRDAALTRLVAVIAWIIAALDITGLLSPTAVALDRAAVSVGTVRISLLMIAKAVLIIGVLVWVALALARLIGARIQHLGRLSPSVQTLATSLVRIILVFLALLIGLNTVGIDLTAFTVFSGAIGVGLGFGLQKIVSNFVSGIILLAEGSIKPGDVIEVGHTYGYVTALGGRYAAVRGRDGKEYLIPNETLITNQVVNWSYSSPTVRLDIPFGVAYGTDLRFVRLLAIDAARATKRVLATPEPVCHVTEFGESSINLLLRFWIDDPANGVVNVKGDVCLALWDRFREHAIELPYPQREIRIRDAQTSDLRLGR